MAVEWVAIPTCPESGVLQGVFLKEAAVGERSEENYERNIPAGTKASDGRRCAGHQSRAPCSSRGVPCWGRGMFSEGATAAGEDPQWSRGKREVEGAVERNCSELTTALHFPALCSGQGTGRGVGSEGLTWEEGKLGGKVF